MTGSDLLVDGGYKRDLVRHHLFDAGYGYEDTLSLWMNARPAGPGGASLR